MIEFDDAGIGCPILGEVYVARRVETDETIVEFIHVNNHHKTFLPDVLFAMLEKLEPKDEEIIALCRGKVFDGFEQFLKKKGIQAKRVKIEGKTNNVAEEAFSNELYRIGLPTSIALTGKDYATFYQCVLLWHKTFYEGERLNKHPNKKRKPKERDYMMNQVCHHPNLLSILFGIKTSEETLV